MNLKYLVLPALALTTLTLTSCNDQEQASIPTPISAPITAGGTATTPTPSRTSTPKPTATPSATPTQATGSYPSCVSSDVNHICIGLKIISYQDSSGVPVLTEADAITLVNGMNTIWSQCNVAFQLEVFQIVDPTTMGLSYSPDWQTETYTVRNKFADKTRFLVAAVGPWAVSTIAVTTMPGSGVYGTVVDKQYAKNPLTVGHELGHYQGLYHVSDTNNLMSAYIGPNTKVLTSSQCTTSRNTDLSNWVAMQRKP